MIVTKEDFKSLEMKCSEEGYVCASRFANIFGSLIRTDEWKKFKLTDTVLIRRVYRDEYLELRKYFE